MIKIAIFGGSFDPPHKGHQMIVQRAVQTLDIDKLIVLPAFLNPFKQSTLASAEQRASWCQTLFDTIPNVEISDYEIKALRPVYTSESLRYFMQEYDLGYLIIGSDNLASISKWHDFDWINSMITWAVAKREGYPMDTHMLRSWIPLGADISISSTDIRDGANLDMIDDRIRQDVITLLNTKGKTI